MNDLSRKAAELMGWHLASDYHPNTLQAQRCWFDLMVDGIKDVVKYTRYRDGEVFRYESENGLLEAVCCVSGLALGVLEG